MVLNQRLALNIAGRIWGKRRVNIVHEDGGGGIITRAPGAWPWHDIYGNYSSGPSSQSFSFADALL